MSHISEKTTVRKEIVDHRNGSHLYTGAFRPTANDDDLCQFIGLQLGVSALTFESRVAKARFGRGSQSAMSQSMQLSRSCCSVLYQPRIAFVQAREAANCELTQEGCKQFPKYTIEVSIVQTPN
jgi:hypothetical protein